LTRLAEREMSLSHYQSYKCHRCSWGDTGPATRSSLPDCATLMTLTSWSRRMYLNVCYARCGAHKSTIVRWRPERSSVPGPVMQALSVRGVSRAGGVRPSSGS